MRRVNNCECAVIVSAGDWLVGCLTVRKVHRIEKVLNGVRDTKDNHGNRHFFGVGCGYRADYKVKGVKLNAYANRQVISFKC